MFTDYTYFSSNLMELCINSGLAKDLHDCMVSGPVDEAVAYLRERLAGKWGDEVNTPSDDLLRKVCQENGMGHGLAEADRITLIDRAIFCSLPDEEELWLELCRMEYKLVRDTGKRRRMVQDLAIKIDEE